ncbi:MAG: hypothetical protein M3R51_04080 [Candidatus Eremiobacteraeota bacterium]|nr:hypothetical protein [Candidatus Eremiobacteraeota bacterium]
MERAPFRVLIGRTFVFLFARFWLYTALTAGCIAAIAITYAIRQSDTSLFIGASLFPPIVVAATYAITGHDAGFPFAARARTVRRFWFVIAIDYIVAPIPSFAIAAFGIGNVWLGVFLLGVAASLTYADVYVVFEDAPDGLIFVRSFWRSAVVTWSTLETIGRTVALLAVGLFTILLCAKLQARLEAQHVPFASFWSQVALGMIALPAVSVLSALVYLDATGHETKYVRGK